MDVDEHVQKAIDNGGGEVLDGPHKGKSVTIAGDRVMISKDVMNDGHHQTMKNMRDDPASFATAGKPVAVNNSDED